MRNPVTGETKSIFMNNKVHNLGSSLMFSLGAPYGYSVNGLYADLTFNYVAGSAFANNDGFENWFNSKVNDHPVISAPSLE